jgi:hypothetical protein
MFEGIYMMHKEHFWKTCYLGYEDIFTFYSLGTLDTTLCGIRVSSVL